MSSPGDFELKYIIDGRSVEAVRRWLGCVCQPDPVHPQGVVSSIYFDTPALHYLSEKINSDYLKTKVRLRWYEVRGAAQQGSFLEAKLRIGTRRRKVRVATPYTGDFLRKAPLNGHTFRDVPAQLRSHGVIVPGALCPVILIRYTRYRFVDVANGLRINLDADISAPAVNRQILPVGNPRPLSTAVVEVKGGATDLPPILRPLAGLGARKAAFSKYLVCYDRAVSTVG